MESFRYFLNIGIDKTINENDITKNAITKNVITKNVIAKNVIAKNNITNNITNKNTTNIEDKENANDDQINSVEWSLFHNQEKKIIIKRNIGKLIGYSGDTIRRIRKKNSNIIIKIEKSSECCNANREIILYGPQTGLKNVISEFKLIIGEENLVY